MDALIKKAEYLNGEVKAPGSKSYTHRVIAAASLYGSNNEEILIENPSTSDANEAMIVACNSLGADISWTKEKNLKIKGVDGNPKIIKNEIDVGNSGTALRIAIALASLAKGQVTITGDASLSDRPTKPLIDALNRLGSNIHGVLRKNKQGEMDEYAPITIDANGLNGGSTFVHDGLSSQYLTSLLFVSNFAKNDVEVNVFGNIVSKPYIKMTLEVLDDFGINVKHSFDYKYFYVKTNQHYKVPTHYKIPGDYSQAAFLLAAACLVDSDITIKGLSSTGEQGDKQIITILRDMGAKIDEVQNGYRVKGSFDLEGTEIDLLKTPDYDQQRFSFYLNAFLPIWNKIMIDSNCLVQHENF